MRDRKYFMRKGIELIPVTSDEFHRYMKEERKIRNIYTIKIHGYVLEVDEKYYKEYYQYLNRRRYLLDQSELYKEFYFSYLDTDDMLGEETIEDMTINVEDTAINHILIEKIKENLPHLEQKEKEIIQKLFYDGISERELAREYGISQPAIHKKKQKILQKIKLMIET